MMTDNQRDHHVLEAIRHAVDLDSTGETGLAVQHLSALIEEVPGVASLHGYLSLFLRRSGRFDEPIENGRLAVELSPESENASFFYSSALWSAGKQIQALDEMKRFFIVNPGKQSKIYSQMIQEWDLGDE